MKILDKVWLKNFFRQRWKLCIFLFFVLLGMILFSPLLIEKTYMPFIDSQDFKPMKVPDSYKNVQENITENSKVFTYKNGDQGYFIVSAIKDTENHEFKKFLTPLKDDHNIHVINESLIINNHHAVFQVKNMKIMDFDIVRFQVVWYCDQTGYTYLAMGVIPPYDLFSIKEMIKTIKCR